MLTRPASLSAFTAWTWTPTRYLGFSVVLRRQPTGGVSLVDRGLRGPGAAGYCQSRAKLQLVLKSLFTSFLTNCPPTRAFDWICEGGTRSGSRSESSPSAGIEGLSSQGTPSAVSTSSVRVSAWTSTQTLRLQQTISSTRRPRACRVRDRTDPFTVVTDGPTSWLEPSIKPSPSRCRSTRVSATAWWRSGSRCRAPSIPAVTSAARHLRLLHEARLDCPRLKTGDRVVLE